MSDCKASETITETFLLEGKRTQGVWLPLALADIQATLIALIRMWAKNPEEVQVPPRSEVLWSWSLPMMAKSIEAAEKEAEAMRMFRAVQRLAEQQAAKDKKNDKAQTNP